MTKTICAFTLLAGLAAAVPARAQAPATGAKTSVSVSVGGQLQERSFTAANEFGPVFDETASFVASHKIDRGVLFDFGAARATGWRDLWVAVSVSTFSKSSNGGIVATIPDRVFFNRPTTATASANDLKHTEVGVNISAMWTFALTGKVDVAVFAGPSFIHLSQDLVTGFDPNANPISATVVNQTATAKGGNAGVDLSYHLTNMYSAGFFIRYAGGTAHLESTPLKVGGGQAGAGIRVRF